MKRLTHEGIEGLVPYPPGKPIEELERELGIRGSIKLASNENPLGPSPKALEAIRANLVTLNRYPDGSCYYLKAKLSEKLNTPPDQIILGNGSNEIIELAVRTFLMAGENAIQPFPTFLVYEKVVTAQGGRMFSVPLKEFSVDLGGILEAINEKTKLIFLNNPNNPTGSALSMEELKPFLEKIPSHIVTLLDEAYIEFSNDPSVRSAIPLVRDYPNLIVLRTFSKLYGLAGLRIGYGVGPSRLVDYMNRVRQPFNANTLAQAAALAALDDQDFVSRTLELTRKGLQYLKGELDNMGIEHFPTQTNFFLIRSPLGGRETYERMLRKGVIIRSMDTFGLPDFIRISVGLPKENERFIQAFREVLGL